MGVRRLLGLGVVGVLTVLSISGGVLSTTVRGAMLYLLMGAVGVGAGIYIASLVNRIWPIWVRGFLILAYLVSIFGGYLAVMFAFWAVVRPRLWMIPKIVTTWGSFLAWLYLPAVPLTLVTWFLIVRHVRRQQNQLGTYGKSALS
ncbi:hypothetical protein L6258_01580 [Candidatus Parcubacteria bacterium]|nr:hypothetical protein [Candidatus Parcubacteria bacterium]